MTPLLSLPVLVLTPDQVILSLILLSWLIGTLTLLIPMALRARRYGRGLAK